MSTLPDNALLELELPLRGGVNWFETNETAEREFIYIDLHLHLA